MSDEKCRLEGRNKKKFGLESTLKLITYYYIFIY